MDLGGAPKSTTFFYLEILKKGVSLLPFFQKFTKLRKNAKKVPCFEVIVKKTPILTTFFEKKKRFYPPFFALI